MRWPLPVKKPGRGIGFALKTLAAVIASSVLLTACGSDGARNGAAGNSKHFGYAVDDYLVTTNAGTNLGISTNAQLMAGRLYPSAYVSGPKGQLIPNRTLVETQVLPGPNQRVIYKIADSAVYSDGKPVTCDAFLLAFTAGSMNSLFESHMPLAQQVDHVDCTAGSKQATVVYKENFGARWRQLFGAGVLMPAHAVAAKAGIDLEELNRLLKSRDYTALSRVADIWNNGFNLSHFDPELQVASGPFKIESVGDKGEVVFVRNDLYNGEKAALDRLVVWPRGIDLNELRNNGSLQIADVTNTDLISWLDRNDSHNPYTVAAETGLLTDSLILGNAGIFSDVEARRALAACVDQASVAKASSTASGVDVQPVHARTVRATDAVNAQLKDIIEPHTHVNIDAAKRLEGKTIKVGYDGPDPRKKAMVEEISKSCAPAGITIEDAAKEAASLADLSHTHVTDSGVGLIEEGTIDAILMAIDPASEYADVSNLSNNVQATRAAERRSWEEVPTIPLASQPRVFVVDKAVGNVVTNTDLSGIGWNMDRWNVVGAR
ncbi:ABC transporter substrate-binding protein [Corynebacterium pseudotuberculosis]|uniref:Peptide ABC transporter n=1 Tax=Corynebacterium pseudotuberculosis 258 TaxID=1168865 RepID=A0AAU8QD10_CORPS|nr:ABC transporter substrate-binding protein [Corynebacterium pseudotuberculosis]AEQ06724.1 peptide ABC transporter [Corynebacterium pseudotuberculosis CIP 52.97]AFH90992.1 peptide ABC transporter [Corynebacterium pseudotuberculosis 31]AFK16817.1 peptide ABC transporter [Corynebacterium pseudotuberculosis 258]AKS13511.1 Oligopeptide-binding protein [Corynebacterium pseudotuberculosis]AMN70118.1 peptide ABC transporter [Corynebacterium pseudotuberculosis]